jgi:excisionase family DNA binding protein
MSPNTRKTTPQPMSDREILNIDGAAALLGVSVKTFSKVLRQGDVPGRKVGREWKFSRQALIDWIGQSRSHHFLDGENTQAASAGASARLSESAARKKRNDGFSVDNM